MRNEKETLPPEEEQRRRYEHYVDLRSMTEGERSEYFRQVEKEEERRHRRLIDIALIVSCVSLLVQIVMQLSR